MSFSELGFFPHNLELIVKTWFFTCYYCSSAVCCPETASRLNSSPPSSKPLLAKRKASATHRFHTSQMLFVS